MKMSSHSAAPYYFVPGPSRWPLCAGMSLLATMIGASGWVNGAAWGPMLNIAGILATLTVLYFWFGDAIGESESGKYNQRIDLSYRWSMSWFIFSEVMFFGAFFGALFYARAISLPWLGDLDHKIIWPDFAAQWGANGDPAGTVESFTTMGPFPIPTINTALLLTSGVTLTIAHHALIAGNRARTIAFMWITVLLGLIFLFVQGFEYAHAYKDLNLKLSSGIFGSTFFMLTGFHGFHVFVGMLMLLFITIRLMKGHFTPERHFGFEGAAWYWHFVDVVWLGLYVVVYWM
jgi:cytochrome c oxidase subunit 3